MFTSQAWRYSPTLTDILVKMRLLIAHTCIPVDCSQFCLFKCSLDIACRCSKFSSNFQCVRSHIDFDYYFQRLLIIRRGLIAWGAQNVAARRGTCPWNFNFDVICCSHGKYSKFFARIRRLQYMSLSLVLNVKKKKRNNFLFAPSVCQQVVDLSFVAPKKLSTRCL